MDRCSATVQRVSEPLRHSLGQVGAYSQYGCRPPPADPPKHVTDIHSQVHYGCREGRQRIPRHCPEALFLIRKFILSDRAVSNRVPQQAVQVNSTGETQSFESRHYDTAVMFPPNKVRRWMINESTSVARGGGEPPLMQLGDKTTAPVGPDHPQHRTEINSSYGDQFIVRLSARSLDRSQDHPPSQRRDQCTRETHQPPPPQHGGQCSAAERVSREEREEIPPKQHEDQFTLIRSTNPRTASGGARQQYSGRSGGLPDTSVRRDERISALCWESFPPLPV